MMSVLVSNSVDETRDIGRRLGAALEPGDVIALIGPLGAGKTQLVKGIARGAGVADSHMVNSPTFVLVNEYEGRLHLYHLDAYRLADETELEALGFDEMTTSNGAVILEWADRVSELLPDDCLVVKFDVLGPERRELAFSATGSRSQTLATAALTF